ncbi:MAG: hypothetical protein JSW61_14260 [Candidatus Thorarchaeota archaeon]|nr:MAG: hypothetical protein JSW61_14260 [Candidatus Thorarchaeota archaeon]
MTKYGGPFRAYEAVAQVTKMRSERPEEWQKMGDLFSKMGQYEAAEKANEFADETLDSHGGLLWTI